MTRGHALAIKGEIKLIVFDTETTGLFSSVDGPLDKLPKIIELFALKIDDQSFEIKDELDLLIDPKQPLSEEIIKVTSITDEMVKGKGAFPLHFEAISRFWLGEQWVAGHNITFDCDMMEIEMRRLGKTARFPWAPKRLCTVELTEHYQGRRMKLMDLHEYLTGEKFESAHRAKADVMATYRCIKELAKRGDLPAL